MCTFLTGAEQVWNVGEKNLHAREKERWMLGFCTLGWEFVPCAAGNKERCTKRYPRACLCGLTRAGVNIYSRPHIQ